MTMTKIYTYLAWHKLRLSDCKTPQQIWSQLLWPANRTTSYLVTTHYSPCSTPAPLHPCYTWPPTNHSNPLLTVINSVWNNLLFYILTVQVFNTNFPLRKTSGIHKTLFSCPFGCWLLYSLCPASRKEGNCKLPTSFVDRTRGAPTRSLTIHTCPRFRNKPLTDI